MKCSGVFTTDGIYHAFKYATPPDDELQLTAQWSELAQQHQIDLVVCISAAQRRDCYVPMKPSGRAKPMMTWRTAFVFPV
jgi:sulfur relay (sulfurtransferase) complex TusBCD TusD component (DsrE family)